VIRIEDGAWEAMRDHAVRAYPEECCGAMLGRYGGDKTVTRAVALENAFRGPRAERYEIRPEDLLAADRMARDAGLDLVGIYHSHPDHDAYFSDTDLKNSCPWYSFVVLSVRGGRFDHAKSFLPDADQSRAETESLSYPGVEVS
jgi:proteasome lid subunit RPN8/RPN11